MKATDPIILEIQREYLDELSDQLDDLVSVLEGLTSANAGTQINSLKRIVHTIKGSSGSCEMNLLSQLCHNFEDFIEMQIELEEDVDSFQDYCYEYIDLMRRYQGSYIPENANLPDKLLLDIQNQMKKLSDSKHKILVVDNSQLFQKHYVRILGSAGISVSLSQTGHQALARLLGEPFDVLVTSVEVGALDGPTLAKVARLINLVNPEMKIILTTSSKSYQNVEGVDIVIQKNQDLFFKIHDYIESVMNQLKSPPSIFDELNEDSSDGVNEEGSEEAAFPDITNIAYVDDDPLLHDLIDRGIMLYGNENVKIDHYHLGEEFLKQASYQKYQLVLMDVMMPGLSGDETCRQMRNYPQLRNCPVIFFTAKNRPEQQQKLKGFPGVIGVIPKPFNYRKVALQISKIWKNR